MPGSERPIVIGLGELLWDCFGDSRRPGGAPANVAFQAGQLGCRGVVCTRVGGDESGDALCGFLSEQGLETDYVQRDAGHATGTVTVETSATGQPTYTIHEDVAWDFMEFTPELETLMGNADAVCFGTLAQRCEKSRHAIHTCLAAASEECLIVYDVNLRQDWYERAWIERSLAVANIVKLNDEEVEVVGPLLTGERLSSRAFAEHLLERFALELVCITRGEEGCSLWTGAESVDLPGVAVRVEDTVGAGDAFTAALITGLLRGWPPAVCGEFANRVGALVASRSGAMPLLGTAIDALFAEFER
ncbi:MAG: carbohydrate kinase [Planctomycetaceae bacterium]|nr:carbohydrate kinase [Planctomycetaceae bacterium]